MNDERITIRPSLVKTLDGEASMEYNVIHSIPSSMLKTNHSSTTRMTLRSMKDLNTYIQSILELLRADESPYASIQLDLPMMPSVLVSPKNLSYRLCESIAKQLSLLETAWPVVPLPVSRRNSVLFNNGSFASNGCFASSCSSNSNPTCCETNRPNTCEPKPNKHIFFNDDDIAYHAEYHL